MSSLFQYHLFDWTHTLESNWEVIKDEMEGVLSENNNGFFNCWTDVHPHYVDSQSKKAWRTFDFMFFGIKNLKNCNACPETYALLKEIPELITAQFSLLKPNTKIAPHKGYSTMILRSHLGLEIPSLDLCKLKVEEEEYSWKKGEVVTFDDSKIHEAWNLSTENRIILMLDVANPNMEYSASEICRYKLEKMDDPFLLEIATKEQWLEWLESGIFL